MIFLQLRETVLASALILLCLCLTACKKEAIPYLDRPQVAAGARMEDVSFKSAAMGREMKYRVFLPATIAAGTKLPVVYLLHGCGEDLRAWSNYSQISNYAVKGYIFVIPDGECSYWVNQVEVPADKYEDYVTRDLISDVDARFSARTGRDSRAVIGTSMGGYAAIYFSLVHPELFSFAGALSPSIDAPSQSFSWGRFFRSKRLNRIFGLKGTAERTAHDPFLLIDHSNPQATPYMYITVAEQESLFKSVTRFANELKVHGFSYEFHSEPGEHDWNEWNKEIPGCMEVLIHRIK